ncbi:phosphatidate cytidylyltransferase [Hydrogenophaga sp. 5NK40-0174]|uniref:phosphatidate cytidylyltransferase n=1 Tax=Hydrogenophaga sp. 5NK40-0174 TaxID=3127649 RepID=UPI003106D79E
MLKQRIITAVLLLLVLLPALFYPAPAPFVVVALVLICAGAWEWARLNGQKGGRALAWAAVTTAGLALMWWSGGLDADWTVIWWVTAVLWAVLSIVLPIKGVTAWQTWPVAIRLVLGLFLLGAAWLALVQAKAHGLPFLLSVLTLVWAADIFAYVGGKTMGRHKLAPSISPGKTWEGAITGAVGVLALAFGWLWFDGQGWLDGLSLFSHLRNLGWPWFVAAVAALVAMSVVGDLIESLVKRSAGVKDSSRLLPGHGGVLDRVDALLPVLPVAMWLISL